MTLSQLMGCEASRKLTRSIGAGVSIAAAPGSKKLWMNSSSPCQDLAIVSGVLVGVA